MLDQATLQSLLNYDSSTGEFSWKCYGRYSCKKAGSPHSRGYVSVAVLKKKYLAHRLAWLYIHGEFPKNQLDHINRNRSDNRIDNLREATNSENCQNKTILKNNTTGYLGVTRKSGRVGYESSIAFNGKSRYLGTFKTPELAHAAYLQAKSNLHKFNPTLN